MTGPILSFEILFALFLFAGRYKADPRFAWVPVDLTATFFVASVAVGLWIVTFRGFTLPRRSALVVATSLLFIVWMIVSTMWSSSELYAVDKAKNLATLVAWATVGGAIVIASKPDRVWRFATVVVALSVWMSIETAVAYAGSSGRQYIDVMGTDYLGLGRTVGLGAVVVLVLLIYGVGKIKYLWLLGLLGTFCFVLLVGGGRGPLLATIAAALIPLAATVRWTKVGPVLSTRALGLILVLAIAGVGAVVVSGERGQTLHRVLLLIDPTPDASAGTRVQYYSRTAQLIAAAPVLGGGIGSWPVRMGYGDSRSYPHNIFIEVLSEGGIVGTVLLCAAFLAGFKTIGWRDIGNNPDRLLVLMMFVNTFVNAQVTGDLLDNRVLFAMLGLTAIQHASHGRGAK